MKYGLPLLVLIITSAISLSYGQSYLLNDTLYVWEMRGANVIASPAHPDQILNKSYYGTAARVVDTEIGEHPTSIEINPGLQIQGNWVKVIVRKDTGYVFDGYLSRFKPFDLRSDDQGIDLVRQNFSIGEAVSKDILTYEPGQLGEGQSRDIRFKNGVRWNMKNIQSCLLESYYIPKVRFAEAYQLMMAVYSNYFDQSATYMSEPEFLRMNGNKYEFILKGKNSPLRISLYHEGDEYIISSYSCADKGDKE